MKKHYVEDKTLKFDRKHIQSYLSLYLVSDRYWLAGRELKDDIRKAIEGGVRFVQIREKELSQDEFVQEAFSIKDVCAQYDSPFVVNDDIEVAKLVDADGVHVGQSDESAKKARRILGEDKIIGVSVQSVEDALQAQEDGADYLGVGAMFSTNTKKDADDVSLETLRSICEAVSIPVVAIGGISEKNIAQLKSSGIKGVAIVSAIMASENIYQASKSLHSMVDAIL